MRFLVGWALLALVLIPSEAQAAGSGLLGKLSRENSSITAVMQKAGCDNTWLSQVLMDSKIAPSRTRSLPVGQPVYLTHGSCATHPSKAVAGISAELLRRDRGQRDSRAVASLRAELDSARQSTKRLEADKLNMLQRFQALTARTEDLVRAAAGAKEELLHSQRNLRRAYIWFSVGFLAILALAAVAFVVILRRTKAERLERDEILVLRRSWPVVANGNVYTFTLSGASEDGAGEYVGKYRCPICEERNLYGRERNLRQHLTNIHLSEKGFPIAEPQHTV